MIDSAGCMNQKDEQSENLQRFLPKNKFRVSLNQKSEKLPVGTVCPKCRYDLRGIERGKPCPECGRLTIRLGHAAGGADLDMSYLRRVVWGVRLILFGWFLIVPSPIVSIIRKLPLVDIFVSLEAGFLLTMIGVWLMTSESELATAAGLTKSKGPIIARIAVATAFSCLVISHFFAATTTTSGIAAFWHSLSYLSMLLTQSLICVIAQPLSDQMQDEPLGRKFWTVAWIIPITGVISVPFLGVAFSGGMIGVFALIILVLPVLFLGSEIALVVFLLTLQRRFAWAVRYQYYDEERTERFRRKLNEDGKSDSV